MARKRGRKRSRKQKNKQQQHLRRPLFSRFSHIERLELRLLLAVTASLDEATSTLTFDSDVAGDYARVRTEDGLVQWSSDGINFSSDLNSSVAGDQQLSLFGQTSLTIEVSTSGGPFGELGEKKIGFQDFWLPGADLIVNVQDVDVEAGATVSTANDTPQIDAAGNAIFLVNGPDLVANQEVAYFNNGDVIGGLDSSFTYFVIKDGTDANKIQLAAASGGSAIDLSTSATTGDTQLFFPVGGTPAARTGGDLIINQKDSSGNLPHAAESIVVQTGGKLLAGADGTTETPGDVLLAVSDIRADESPGTPRAEVTLTDATIRGATVEITSVALDNGDFGFDEVLVLSFLQQEIFGPMSVLAGVVTTAADANITISGGSITAAGNLVVSADATADADVTVFTVYVGVAVGTTDPNATISIQDGATIVASGDVDIRTSASTDMQVVAQRHSKTITSVSLFSEPVNIAVAVADTDIDSKATLAEGTSITSGGNVNVEASATKSTVVSTISSAGRKGVAGASITVNLGDTDVDAFVDGEVRAVGNVTVSAESDAPVSETFASTTVGESNLQAKVKNFKQAAAKSILSGVLGFFTGKGLNGFKNNQTDMKSINKKFGVAAAWAWSD